MHLTPSPTALLNGLKGKGRKRRGRMGKDRDKKIRKLGGKGRKEDGR